MVTGIIAEFNPLHNGHEYILKKMKQAGGAAVVVLSGSIVQRGEPAFLSKEARTKQALSAGADLVLELPSVYSGASAEKFAMGGVSTLVSSGTVDCLAFGCELCDAGILTEIAGIFLDEAFLGRVKEIMHSGAGFAMARETALSEISKVYAEAVSGPNNILAVEYIKSLKLLGSDMKIMPVERIHAAHDAGASGKFASSGYLRKMSDIVTMRDYVPAGAFAVIEKEKKAGRTADIRRMERAMLFSLSQKTPEEVSLAADMNEGLEYRIIESAKEVSTYNELIERIKTKRYTDSRIRRALLDIFLANNDRTRREPVPYIRVLGFNRTGADILKRMKQTASVPVITRSSDGNRLTGRAGDVFKAEARAFDFRALCCENYDPSANDYRYTPVRYL